MSLSEPFIRRPVATVLIAIGILLLGLVALARLPIASLPSVERPTISVSSELPGASAETIAASLAQPLERELGVIPGIIEMGSYSAPGSTQITLQFNLETDIDAAAGQVQAAINAASSSLPKDLPWPPRYHKANPAGNAPIALALTSDIIAPGDVYDYADRLLVQRLSQLPGVADVRISGGERSAVRVQVDPRRVAAMNISLEEVRRAIRASAQNLPKGTITVDGAAIAITANDQRIKAADYRDVVVAYRNGAAVKLRDIAGISDSVLNTRSVGWFGDRRAILVYVLKQPDANVVEVVDAIKDVLPQLGRLLPAAIKVDIMFDRTTLIRAAIADVDFTIKIAIALVILTVALFLRRLWATLIPAFTIPVVLAATLVVMALAGYSLDNLSLMALVIAIGFIVDDAIIIVENVTRLTDEGQDASSASLLGARQMGFTIISITGALIGALLPILFMPDVVGRYFREFGVTLSAAILASAVVSLTLTPVMCSRLLRPRQPGGGGRRDAARRQPSATRAYLISLDWALRHPAVVTLFLLLTLAGSAGLYAVLPKGFMPTEDIGLLTVRTVTTANVSFAAMQDLHRRVTDAVQRDAAVQSVASFVSDGSGSHLSAGTIWVSLKKPEERMESMQQVIVRLRAQLGRMAGVRCFFTPWRDLNLGVRAGAARFQYTLSASDPDVVWTWSETMRRKMLAMPQLTDIISSAERSGLEAGLVIDRDRAAAFGVTPFEIDQTLYDAFGQRMVSPIYLPSNWSQVILEVGEAARAGPSAFDSIYVRSSRNVQVPLSSLMRARRGHAAAWLRHNDQFPSVTLSFDTRPGVSLGEAIALIRAAEAEIRLPDDIKAQFSGEAAEATKAPTAQILLFLGAVFAIYVMLGMLYESYWHPLTILATLPSALLGALLALALTGTEFTLMAAIACILVIGVVMKNAIMMVDFALAAQRQDGLTAGAAIRSAAALRVRPIVMTSCVAILSAVPLALGTGPGHELRQPLGIAVVGGLLTAQILTLYTTPAVFLFIDHLISRGRTRKALPATA